MQSNARSRRLSSHGAVAQSQKQGHHVPPTPTLTESMSETVTGTARQPGTQFREIDHRKCLTGRGEAPFVSFPASQPQMLPSTHHCIHTHALYSTLFFAVSVSFIFCCFDGRQQLPDPLSRDSGAAVQLPMGIECSALACPLASEHPIPKFLGKGAFFAGRV